MPRGIPSLAAAMVTAGLLGLVATPVIAQTKGFYVEGTAGVSLPEDSEVDANGASVDVSLDTGFAGGLAVGYDYGNQFRTEFELGLHRNDLDRSPGVSIDGDTHAFSFMVNGYYDIDVGGGPLKPFVGIGAGGARVNLDANSQPNVVGAVDESDTAFAWQGMAGVSYALSDQLSASVRYRYFSVPNLDYTSNGGTAFDTEYASHDILFGLRWAFNAPKPMMAPKPEPVQMAPPPPPPPPPAPPPPPLTRNFIVFFDFDSAALTSQARGIIRAAADESRKRSGIRIALTGHTDRAGRTAYNQRLSMRRAEAVKNELIRLGIPGDTIGVTAKGESDPLVSTADGVREPQNRRVEIVLQ